MPTRIFCHFLAAEWSSGRIPTCCIEDPSFEPAALKVVSSSPRCIAQEFSKSDFHQKKLSSLSITYNIKWEGALYSVFCAEASKTPSTSLNIQGMFQTSCLTMSSLRLPLRAGHISWINFKSVAWRQRHQRVPDWALLEHNISSLSQ